MIRKLVTIKATIPIEGGDAAEYEANLNRFLDSVGLYASDIEITHEEDDTPEPDREKENE